MSCLGAANGGSAQLNMPRAGGGNEGVLRAEIAAGRGTEPTEGWIALAHLASKPLLVTGESAWCDPGGMA